MRALRFDPSKHADAKAWHAAAKDLLSRHLTLNDGPSLSQRIRPVSARSQAFSACQFQGMRSSMRLIL